MISPTDPTRGPAGPPTAAEVATLTARLRELSARGREVDPAERAAFLADKDALISRILADADMHGPGAPSTRVPAGDGQSTEAQVERAHRATAACLPPSAVCRDEMRREQLARGTPTTRPWPTPRALTGPATAARSDRPLSGAGDHD
jgi:hypothetical protein